MPYSVSPYSKDVRCTYYECVSLFLRYETHVVRACLPFSSLETEQLTASV
jgi:hypothetical protein